MGNAERQSCDSIPAMDDKSRLEALYSEHNASLQRHVRSTLNGAEDADDVVQDTFVRLMVNERASRSLLGAEAPAAYLFRMARNLAVDRLRQLNARRSRDNAVSMAAEPIDESPEPADVIVSQQRLQALQRVVQSLPQRRRQVFYLHKIRQMTYSEVARYLDISVSMVEKHMMKALAQIDRELGGDQT